MLSFKDIVHHRINEPLADRWRSRPNHKELRRIGGLPVNSEPKQREGEEPAGRSAEQKNKGGDTMQCRACQIGNSDRPGRGAACRAPVLPRPGPAAPRVSRAPAFPPPVWVAPRPFRPPCGSRPGLSAPRVGHGAPLSGPPSPPGASGGLLLEPEFRHPLAQRWPEPLARNLGGPAGGRSASLELPALSPVQCCW